MIPVSDLLPLLFALAILCVISAARIGGKLPHRGRRRMGPSHRTHRGRAAITSAKPVAKPSSFRGILAHYDGPVRSIEPRYTA